MDTEQMFRLIDSILPFEACLYYQFLPLALEGKHLKLGMVEPTDSSALDYVRHILAYLNCSLKTEQIDTQTHQSMLSAYLSHTNQSSSLSKNTSQDNQDSAPTDSTNLHLQDSDHPLSPEDESQNEPSSSSHTAQKESKKQQASLAPEETHSSQNNLALVQRLSKRRKRLPKEALASVSAVSSQDQEITELEVQTLYLSRPIEFIATLEPQQLLQELLGRMLVSGIGRLYFERQPEQGRILWSQDGVLQSVIEGLALPIFQAVIIELKRFVDIPLLPVDKPKQVEIERRYQQECLLLRLRVMPGTYGEEATLQVLRGVALKFYQRQRLEKLGQEALRQAGQLERKLKEIRNLSSRYTVPPKILPALNQLLQSLEEQLKALAELQINQE
ncbi:MAG: hypothetical protein WA919_01030 [Coleofasciculaceae cyanobacterium]